MSDECIFCRIVKGQIPSLTVYEDADILAFLDVSPLSDGHTLIIPKEHYENIHSCPNEVLAAIGGKLGTIAKALMQAVGCDSYNVLCNNGKSASQVVMHLHFHIIPRKQSDGVFTQWPAKKIDMCQAKKIAETIKSAIK